MDQTIRFNRAVFEGRDLEYLREAIAGGHVSGGGPFTSAAERVLSDGHDASAALLTTSCTHALEMSALLLNLEPADEVIVPAYTFVSTASAFLLRGGRPVFSDVSEDTLNLDVDMLDRVRTARTRAVCTVNYAGIGADLERLSAYCRAEGLTLIEDNAHGLFGRQAGKPLGTFGSLSTLSFHETKNVTCGEGGALVVNDASLVERAEILRDKGTDRSRFFRGEVDRYTWVDVGSSWVLSDMLAGMLLGQLERFEEIQHRRHRIWARYNEGLADWATREGIRLPTIPDGVEHTAHLFHLRTRSGADRDRFIALLKERGVHAVFHYQPLHLSSVGRQLGGQPGQFPVTEDAGDTLVRLPLHGALTETDVETVIEAVTAFRSGS
ncbi:MAG: dTDP-4-amino-4,6-dideoxygalactose transaminase [Nitriliruptor sp.]|nr:MAG: dTDP-4-amino-4,6-dideoxygalactose transaminase [Nitriliruptor sp.]